MKVEILSVNDLRKEEKILLHDIESAKEQVKPLESLSLKEFSDQKNQNESSAAFIKQCEETLNKVRKELKRKESRLAKLDQELAELKKEARGHNAAFHEQVNAKVKDLISSLEEERKPVNEIYKKMQAISAELRSLGAITLLPRYSTTGEMIAQCALEDRS